VLYDLAIAGVKMGVHIAAATPKQYPFDQNVLDLVKQNCQGGATIELTTDPLQAVKDADIIVTDTWYSPLPHHRLMRIGSQWVRNQKRHSD
jgi:ornithine carbamoyltransferase